MREVFPGPLRGRHPPNISNVSLPLAHPDTQTHTYKHIHGQTDTLTHSHTHQTTHPPRRAHTHTTYILTDPHSQADTLPDRHIHSHRHTPAIERLLDLILGAE